MVKSNHLFFFGKTTQIITDHGGDNVEVPLAINKIGDLWHAHNQIIFMLGAADKLVGTTDNFKKRKWANVVYPRLKDVEALVIGTGAGEVNYEETMKLEPDVVFASAASVVDGCRQYGLACLNVSFQDYDGLRSNVNITGKVLGGEAEKRAAEWKEYLDKNIALVEERMKDVPMDNRTRVLHIGNTTKLTTVDGLNCIVDEWIKLAGGQNALFGKTTGSTQCDGYAAGRLFIQGAELKNLEFIQYHPTTLMTPQKCMLISEAARGEGGRLFYDENGRRVYFMEDKYGSKGNLMTRDVISREIDAAGRPVFLDVSFLDGRIIDGRLPEIRDLCARYAGIDIHTTPIPVQPSVHFFMGGLAVHLNHETNIRNLFAVGECASIYHGANRLGGNSLLAAIYSGNVAAEAIADRSGARKHLDFGKVLREEREKLEKRQQTESRFPVMYIRDMVAETMRKQLGIVRSEENLADGLKDMDYYISVAERINYDPNVMPYFNYSLPALLTLARATLQCALYRRESRGAHYRRDYPETDAAYQCATLISYNGGEPRTKLDKEGEYES